MLWEETNQLCNGIFCCWRGEGKRASNLQCAFKYSTTFSGWSPELKIPLLSNMYIKYFVKLSTILVDIKINEEIKNEKNKITCYHLFLFHPFWFCHFWDFFLRIICSFFSNWNVFAIWFYLFINNIWSIRELQWQLLR